MTTNLLIVIIFMLCLPVERRWRILAAFAVFYIVATYVWPFVAPSLVWLVAPTPGSTLALVGIIMATVFVLARLRAKRG